MFVKTNNGYLVECEFCLSQEFATTLRIAKSKFDFHTCESVSTISDYSLVEVANVATSNYQIEKPGFLPNW